MVICLERGADLHMAQLMPLPLTVSCFSKIQIGLPFWYRLTRVVLDKGPLNRCVCVVLLFVCGNCVVSRAFERCLICLNLVLHVLAQLCLDSVFWQMSLSINRNVHIARTAVHGQQFAKNASVNIPIEI